MLVLPRGTILTIARVAGVAARLCRLLGGCAASVGSGCFSIWECSMAYFSAWLEKFGWLW